MTGREERKSRIEKNIQKMLEGRPKLLSDYVSYCFSVGHQPTSVKLYLSYIIDFVEFINNECTVKSVKEILPLDISDYLSFIRTKIAKDGSEVPTSTSYRATGYSALKSFFEFLRMNRVISDNPVAEMKRPKITDSIPQEHLTLSEMKSVVEYASEETESKEEFKIRKDCLRNRNIAILRMFLELGIRCSALICIDVDSVDLESKKIVYKDKGEKLFEKPLSDELVCALKIWLIDREKMEPKTNALFVSEKKNRCSYGTILSMVKNYTKAATGREMSVHKLRHSAITAMYELNGNDIVQTSRFAGHSSVIMTQRYINTDYTQKELELSAKLGSML